MGEQGAEICVNLAAARFEKEMAYEWSSDEGGRDGFARDMAALFASGAPLAEVARVAAAHGVGLAGGGGSPAA